MLTYRVWCGLLYCDTGLNGLKSTWARYIIIDWVCFVLFCFFFGNRNSLRLNFKFLSLLFKRVIYIYIVNSFFFYIKAYTQFLFFIYFYFYILPNRQKLCLKNLILVSTRRDLRKCNNKYFCVCGVWREMWIWPQY